MRAFALLFGLALLLTPACSNNSSVNTPTTPSAAASFAGTWVGTATDSTGSMMGSGLGNIGTMTWVLTQSGSQVTGTMAFSGLSMTPGMAAPTISGTASGNTLAFTAMMPTNSMPAPYTSCSANANGTLMLNSAGSSMTGTYAGSSSCVGGFANGQMTLTRR